VIVVLDTNVWVSALQFGGTPELALKKAFTVDQIAISDFIEAEVLRVLTGKFRHGLPSAQILLDEFLRKAVRVKIHGGIAGICRDPKDDAVLETALVAKADLLIAGDKDLLILESFRGTAIVTPAAYLFRDNQLSGVQ
jgi:putative PIN family toxin of toxin-antitoxin system